MKTGKLKKFMCMLIISLLLVGNGCTLLVQADAIEADCTEKFITVDGKRMHVVLYGELNPDGNTFTDQGKDTIVMFPALAVPSPNIYFKPLAEALDTTYNVVIVEPFGYGLSDITEEERTVENINREIYEALSVLRIDICTLLVHSISGVYGLDFIYTYPEKVNGFIAIDNTVYDEGLSEIMQMEQEYIKQAAVEFESIRNTFENTEDFKAAIEADPLKYGAELPDIKGYNYSEEDYEEYYEAYARSSNQTVQNEIQNMMQSLESIREKKFPNTLPVLTMLSSDNVEAMPVWETAHQNQLDLNSGKHKLYTVSGNHYIWYTNLETVVQLILGWKTL